MRYVTHPLFAGDKIEAQGLIAGIAGIHLGVFAADIVTADQGDENFLLDARPGCIVQQKLDPAPIAGLKAAQMTDPKPDPLGREVLHDHRHAVIVVAPRRAKDHPGEIDRCTAVLLLRAGVVAER